MKELHISTATNGFVATPSHYGVNTASDGDNTPSVFRTGAELARFVQDWADGKTRKPAAEPDDLDPAPAGFAPLAEDQDFPGFEV